MNNQIKWLQISDLHVFEGADTEIIAGHWKKLAEAISPQFILVTGDYRHLGEKTKYKMALEYLQTIIEVFNIEKKDVYLIPGNHDVNPYTGREEVIKEIIDKIAGEDPRKVDYNFYSQFLKGNKSLLKAFAQYRKFVKAFYGDNPVEDARIDKADSVVSICRDNAINIIQINTALISDNSKKHKQILDINSLAKCEITNSQLPTIAIGHHYPSDIEPAFLIRMKSIFEQKNVSAYLCGDVHLFRNNEMLNYDAPYEGIPCISCSKSAPESGDPYSDIGCIFYSYDKNGKIEYNAYNWTVDGGFKIDPRSQYDVNKTKFIHVKKKELIITHKKASEITKSEKDSFETQDFYVDELAKAAFERGQESRFARAILMQAKEFQKKNKNDVPKDILPEIFETYIVNSKSSNALAIHGIPGTGKSTLLSLLFYYARTILKQQAYIIDLHKYDDKSKKMSTEMFNSFVEEIEEELNESEQIFLFVDGLNLYIRHYPDIEKRLRGKLNNWKKKDNIKIIYAIGTLDNKLFPPYKELPNARISTFKKIELNHLFINDEKFNWLTSQVMDLNNIANVTKTRNIIKNYCGRMDGNKSCFRTINFVAKQYKEYKDNLLKKPVAELLYDYYKATVGTKKMNILAEMASDFIIEKPNAKLDTSFLKGPAYLDFFFALHYVALVIDETKTTNVKQYNWFFTSRINHFVNELVHGDHDKENKFIHNLISCFSDELPYNTRLQIVYFLGRVDKDNSNVNEVIEFLKDLFDDLMNRYISSKKTKEEVMLLRSIGISLLYLGCVEREEQFYTLLIYDEAMNRINRDFHVAYYTADSYKLSVQNVFTRTDLYNTENVKRVYNFLFHSVKKGDKQETRNINIITMISFVVYCLHGVAKYRNNSFKNFNKKLEELKTDARLPILIRDYIAVVNNELSKEEDYYCRNLRKLYSFKTIKRRGWIDREIDKSVSIESDADHSWMCCMIANVLLTDNIYDCELIPKSECKKYEDDGYSKQEVINILLVHDIPEIITGDIASPARTDEDHRRESEAINVIRALGCFPYMSSLYSIAEQCISYSMDHKENAPLNVQLASDIDKIEPIIQLFFYRKYLKKPYDYQEYLDWVNHSSFQLYTSFGRNLHSLLEQHIFKKKFFTSNKYES